MKVRIRERVKRALVVLALVGMAPSLASAADNVVLQWNAALLDAISATRMAPTPASRALAIVNTAMYDAWAPYDDRAVATLLGAHLRQPPRERSLANKQQAMSFAAYRALTDLFPSQTAQFDAVMMQLGYDPTDTSLDRHTPTGVGNIAGGLLVAARHHDGSNQLGDLNPGAYSDYTGYVPVNGPDAIVDPNRWQQLRVPDGAGGFVVQKPLTPHWKNVEPFALKSSSQFRPGPPALYPSDSYRVQVEEIVTISATLDDRQKVIADYWADGPRSTTPPGHWCEFGRWISRRDGHSLDQDVKLFFALGNAVMDAGIAVWEAKYYYDYSRPVTGVRFFYNDQLISAWGGPGQGARTMLGQEWHPYQKLNEVTPPFPEYVSGHSGFSAASAEILKSFTGSDVFGVSVTIPAGGSAIEPGLTPSQPVTLYWATFSEAADEAGVSRRYGGIHWKDGDLVSREMGRRIGAQVWKVANRYFKGKSPKDHKDHKDD